MKRAAVVTIVLTLIEFVTTLSSSLGLSAEASTRNYVEANGTSFSRGGQRYRYIGANVWYAANLGSSGKGGDRARLIRELDRLHRLGVTNLRLLAGSEGPDTEPWRLSPSLQPAPGQYNDAVFIGLDFTLKELKARGMTAVLMLTNFWEWSGGMSQYRAWAGAGPIPYPPDPNYISYTSKFYSDRAAQALFDAFVARVVTRTNTFTQTKYRDDPTIMAWELANEPRGARNQDSFNEWIVTTAHKIHELDSHHMITTGVEGDEHEASSGLDMLRNHRSPDIAYATLHIWPQNAGVYDPKRADDTFPRALTWSQSLIDNAVQITHKLGKPLVIEEFGLAREQNSFDPKSAVGHRNQFYSTIFEAVTGSGDAETRPRASGANFWAWGGEGRPPFPFGGWWKPGDPWLGDPAHEPQGWYSVFTSDASTLAVIRASCARLH